MSRRSRMSRRLQCWNAPCYSSTPARSSRIIPNDSARPARPKKTIVDTYVGAPWPQGPLPTSQRLEQSVCELKLVIELLHADALVQSMRARVVVDVGIEEQAAHAVHRQPRVPQEQPVRRAGLH